MNKLITAPAFETFISFFMEYPIQTILYTYVFQYFTRSNASISITITTLVVNFISNVIANAYIFNKSLFEESKLYKQGTVNFIGTILLTPPLVYILLYIFRKVNPTLRIILILLISELLGFLGRIILTYYFWEYKKYTEDQL